MAVRLSAGTAVAEGKKLRFWWLQAGRVVGEDSILQFTIADSSAAGQYWLVVANACGADTVLFATLRIPRVEILQQPPRQLTVREGSLLELTVVAREGRRYQWFRNGEPLSGATQPTLSIPSARLSDSGSYFCRVYGLCDSLDSEVTLVRVEGLGVEDAQVDVPLLRVVPQPAGDRVWIELRARTVPLQVGLYSPQGKRLWQWEIQPSQPTFELELSSYAAGVYWLVVQSSAGQQRLPLLILR
jgi:hypothetical protein